MNSLEWDPAIFFDWSSNLNHAHLFKNEIPCYIFNILTYFVEVQFDLIDPGRASADLNHAQWKLSSFVSLEF